ncbi:MaoC family dehydratase [Massilia terrae]|uniref:MaoC family dehydratase n=1 Tax=Massilia terrae TaxID=1811224 RepID=A0ABT2CUH6_9BURK|nr:MaoC family dehydratase [Massilia terrae]MCS0657630.1 MaoC family dehydratase [Massilia terrae]
MREIASLQDLGALVGTDVAQSRWFDLPQQRIDTFADATDDHQWIHVDPERCRRESPFGVPIAHGFLTLSLLPAMLESALRIGGLRLTINYGVNRLRFPAPVPVDSRVRASFALQSFEPIEGGAQIVWQVTVEREGGAKPVCAAEFVLRLYN